MKSELTRSVRVPRAAVALLTALLWVIVPSVVAQAPDDARDWAMYNRDVIGTRHNPGETALDRSTARGLEEKWRFPAKGSNEQIGVIHATPVVVNGYVYFGTTTDPTFYKLARRQGPLEIPPTRCPRRRGAGEDSVPAVRRRNHGVGARHR